MSSHDPLSCSRIKRLEEAGTSLVAASRDYLKLCLRLELDTDAPLGDTKPKDFASRIDSTLVAVHMTLSRQLNESSAALARARNKLLSSFSRLPKEIVAEIFSVVVYDRSDDEAFQPMERAILLTYRRLYRLLGVCSAWRDVVVSTGTLWALIPVLSNSSINGWQPSQLSLQRAGGSPLHLAVVAESPISSSFDELIAVLGEYGPRICAINIKMDNPARIMASISKLFQHDPPGLLSELSIRCYENAKAYRLPQDSDYIAPPSSTHQASFANLLGGLSAFRIRGAQFHWDALTFSTRLVELRIEQIVLGYDDATFSFLQALSSASNLRDLKISSVTTFRRPGAARIPTVPSPTIFSNLQSLLVEDLYLNTLEHLLPMVIPGSCHFSLFLSYTSVRMNILGGGNGMGSNDTADLPGLCRLLRKAPVNVLAVNGYLEGAGLSEQFAELVQTMPTLKTLKIHSGSMDRRLCEALTRVNATQTPAGGQPLPELQTLHFSRVTVPSIESFREMVVSYPLRELVLGGRYGVSHSSQRSRWEPFQESNSVIQWLRANSPDLNICLVGDDYCPPEFYRDEWKLW